MLPAFEFGYAEGHDVGIEKSATPLQHGKESAIDFGDRGLERFGVGAPRERQRFPPGLSEVLLFPRAIELGSIAGGNQSFQSGRKSAQPPNRLHAGNVESAAILRYPNSRLNLARSCAGAGHFSRRFSRLPPAPVVAAVAPLSWGSPVRSRSPAASRCCMRPSSRSASSDACNIETPRGCENGPEIPRTMGLRLLPREQAVSERIAARSARHLRMSGQG